MIADEQLYVPERFQRTVALHVVKQFLRQDVGRVPLLLGIHGRPGNGKTYQCERVLDDLGAQVFLISGGQLESATAGEPARLVRDVYLSAGRSLEREECAAAAILLNDIDTGIGDWGEQVQYTVNRQTVYGELMHLADYPNIVEGRKTPRIPILMTGNDFARLYEPLVRSGRMTTFEWEPTHEERLGILKEIYSELPIEEVSRLMQQLDAAARTILPPEAVPLPISFFAHLKSLLVDDLLWSAISGAGLRHTMEQIYRGREPRLQTEVSFERLLPLGLHLLKTAPREDKEREGVSPPLFSSGFQLFKSGPFADYLRIPKNGRHVK